MKAAEVYDEAKETTGAGAGDEPEGPDREPIEFEDDGAEEPEHLDGEQAGVNEGDEEEPVDDDEPEGDEMAEPVDDHEPVDDGDEPAAAEE